MPLRPQHAGLPLKLHQQRVHLAVLGHLQRHLARHAVPAGERVALIDRVVGDFEALDGARHVAQDTRKTIEES